MVGDDRAIVLKIPAGVSGTALAASLLRDGWTTVQTIDGEIAQQLSIRRKHRETVGVSFFDASVYAQGKMGVFPEALSPKPGHLSHSQHFSVIFFGRIAPARAQIMCMFALLLHQAMVDYRGNLHLLAQSALAFTHLALSTLDLVLFPSIGNWFR
ncbi:hypothetical protein ACS0TY_014256 [Phlomoides rotata]